MIRRWPASCLLLLCLALCGLLPLPTRAQSSDAPVRAQARVDRIEMHVGDVVNYELVAIAPPDVQVHLPALPKDVFGVWEVRECAPLPTSTTEDGVRSGWRCSLTIWTVGAHELPVQEVRFVAGGSEGLARTQPLLVQVVSVLDPGARDIKPLKPQLMMTDPLNLLLLIGFTILGLLVLAAAVVGLLYYRRMQPAAVPVAAQTRIDPRSAALRELERIAGLRLVEQGRIAEHYVLIADLLRSYIRHSYGVPALERTTTEIRAALGLADRSQPGSLVTLLSEADAVKFARVLPSPDAAQQMLERARQAILADR